MKNKNIKKEKTRPEDLEKCLRHIEMIDYPFLRDSLGFSAQIIAMAYLRASLDLAFSSAVSGDVSKEDSQIFMEQNILELTKHYDAIARMYMENFDCLYGKFLELKEKQKKSQDQ